MRLLVPALALSSLFAQQDGDALLAGIRRKMRENLSRLPDYTCRLTIERSTGAERSKHLRPIDTVHIEVGYVEGKELYAWPGQKFASKGLEDMMPPGGLVGTGDFALHVKSIFLADSATFTYAGRVVRNGRDVIQFDYVVPRRKSRYLLRTGQEREVIVGYHGSLWADADTLLLSGLEIHLDDVPAALHVRRAGSSLHYALARIGGADFLLPQSSELFIVDTGGNESRNRTRFEQCRQYMGESVVSFAEPAPAAERPSSISEIQLPAGLMVEMVLQTPIDGTKSVIGDPISAVVSRDATRSGMVVIPKGAKVTGRITRLGQRTGGRIPYQVLGLRITSIEFAEYRAEFNGSIESLALASAQITLAPTKRVTPNHEQSQGIEGSILFVKGNSLHIPAGAHMFWRTNSAHSE
jgi:hypothetical protein